MRAADVAALAADARSIPGTTDGTPLLIVSRARADVAGVVTLSAADLLTAWSSQ